MPSNPRQGPDIWFADLDGSNQIAFVGTTAPYPVPRPQSQYGVNVEDTQDGEGGGGVRTFQLAGNHVSRRGIEFKMAYINSGQAAWLDARYDAEVPGPFKFTLDGGTSWFAAVFQPNGWVGGNWTSKWTKQEGEVRVFMTGALA